MIYFINFDCEEREIQPSVQINGKRTFLCSIYLVQSKLLFFSSDKSYDILLHKEHRSSSVEIKFNVIFSTLKDRAVI